MAHLGFTEGYARSAIGYHVQTPEQSAPLQVTDALVLCGEVAQSGFEIGA